jgi:hypothetical protein
MTFAMFAVTGAIVLVAWRALRSYSASWSSASST